MTAIEEIQRRLAKYAHVRYEIQENSITVFPVSENGFEVTLLSADDGSFSVFFDGWHGAFPDRKNALDCFSFGLSGECRLREFSRGGKAYKWTVEYRENNEWVAGSTTGLLGFAFWRPRSERCLQNSLVL
ncbi:MAG TPA: hypothetical protein VMZ26_14010 [Pyrinomonadaceae bacterium]|nr:hypothetical protein [Pyrinomonadaceae bacterium]